MAFEGLRKKLRSLAGSGSDAAKEAASDAPERAREARARARSAGKRTGKAVKRVAPASDLEGNRGPTRPNPRKQIARRLQHSGQMHKPIEDANLKPGADPRFMEEFARGDADTGEWFGESDEPMDANEQFFAGSEETVGTQGDFVGELLDERDHEGGHYAYEDDHERGMLDDGVDFSGAGVDFRW